MATTKTAIPFVYQQYFTNSGAVASGYLLFTYASGTSTKEPTYTDAAGTTPQSNPIVLDAGGRPPLPIFLSATAYKFILAPPTDTDPPTSPVWTADGISAAPPFNVDLDVSGTAGETIPAGAVVFLSAGDGGRTSGRWYNADADFDYASIKARSLGFVTVGNTVGLACTVRLGGRITGLTGLTAGLEYYVSATAGATTTTRLVNVRRVGQSDTTTSLIINTSQLPNSDTLLYMTRTGTANSVGTDTTLNSFTLPANYLDVGRGLRMRAWVTAAANANAKTLRVKIGALTLIVLNASTTFNNILGMLQADFFVTAANTVQVNATFQSVSATVGTTAAKTSGAVTLTTTNAVVISGQGVATSDLTDDGMSLEFLVVGDY